jgi:hypothetical protein
MKTFKEFIYIIEGYREPNIERMDRKIEKVQKTVDNEKKYPSDLESLREPLYKRKKPAAKGEPHKNVYTRNYQGKPTRNLRGHDLESVNRQEIFLNDKRSGNQKRLRKLKTKRRQYENDPLSYMSRAMGGPHADEGMGMHRRPLKRNKGN